MTDLRVIKDPPVVEPLSCIDMSAWDLQAPPARQWGVRDRIPLRQPTLLSGEGATGKTLLLLQQSCAHVLGRDWLGMLPEPGPALYIGAEDEEDEIQRRLTDMASHYRCKFTDLIEGGLRVVSFAGKDALLGIPDRTGIIQPTPLFQSLRKTACDLKPKLIGIDPAADVFGGQENDRGQVRQFVGILRGLAIEANSALVINSHPSLTGISTGTGLSGSTSWHNSVRARMYLKAASTEDGYEVDPDLRELEFKKNNYGPIANRILLRWKNGVFVPEGTNSLDKLASERKSQDLFVSLLDRFNRQDRNVSEKPNAGSYGPTQFAREPEAREAKVRKRDFEDAMTSLFTTGKIKLEPYGPPSRGTSRLVTV